MGRFPVIVAAILAAGAISAGSARADDAQIVWKVEQPFRFLRYASDHRIHEAAFEAIGTDADFRTRRVSLMESILNRRSFWTTPGQDGRTLAKATEEQRRLENRAPETVDLRLGWSSLLRSSEQGGMSGTCWDADVQTYRSCFSDASGITGGNGYIIPEAHFVEIRIAGAEAGAECSLAIEGDISPGTGFLEDNRKTESRETRERDVACDEAALMRIPWKTALTVRGSVDGSDIGPVTVEVTDYMIASLGDSFASGEGNPDLPALLDDAVTIKPRYDEADGGAKTDFGIPRRKARPDGTIASFSSARWLDRRCHRSMYSAHTRAAIALALSGDRHHAVTYVSYACSGAEITEGFFWPQDGRECLAASATNYRFMEPQISALVNTLGSGGGYAAFSNDLHPQDRYRREVLAKLSGGTSQLKKDRGYCRPWPGGNYMRQDPVLRRAVFDRPIDLLFLGIGGNDMGFAPLVTSLVLTEGFTDPFGDIMAPAYAMAAGGIKLADAQANIGRLDGRYRMLAKAIDEKLEIDDPSRVLLTGYPSPAYDADGRLCDSARKGMNATRLFRLRGPGETQGLVNIAQAQAVVDRLNRRIENDFARQYGFRFVGDFIPRFKRHGICATSGTANAEKLDLPHKASGAAWQVFNPATDFYPYASRQRWFRTFNDSLMLMYHYKDNAYDEKAVSNGNPIFFALRTLGGPVHPTAQGHAAVADSLYCAAAAKLLAGQKDAECR